MQKIQPTQQILRIMQLARIEQQSLSLRFQGWLQLLRCHIGLPLQPAARDIDMTVALKWQLSVVSLGLQLDNEVVRIAVGLRLGLPLCRPHQCTHCEAEVNDRGAHNLSCRFSKGRHPRHSAVNDVVKRSLETAKIPAHLEPTDIYRSDGKRLDGASVVLWRGRRVLVWDVTCPDTLAPYCTACSMGEAGAVAAKMERRKKEKYAHLDPSHFFVPITIETLGAMGPEAGHLFRDLAQQIAAATSEPLSHQYLLQ